MPNNISALGLKGYISEYFKLPHTAEQRKTMVGDRMKDLRTKSRLTQRDVCEIIEITPQTYSGYENGKYEPTMETLVRLSLLYTVSIDFLLCRNEFALDFKDENNTGLEYYDNIVENKTISELSIEVELLKRKLSDFEKRFSNSEPDHESD